MTTEPAGVGTADETRTRSVEAIAAGIAWRIEQTLRHSGLRMPGRVKLVLRDDIASAITAAESRAMERCAKIADSYREGWENEAVNIAFAIRSSINPPGEEE